MGPFDNREIESHNLAILRASVEKITLGAYFGSSSGLRWWIDDTKKAGLINSEEEPTDFGIEVYEELRLSELPKLRSMFWDGLELEAKVNQFYKGKFAQ